MLFTETELYLLEGLRMFKRKLHRRTENRVLRGKRNSERVIKEKLEKTEPSRSDKRESKE